MPDDAGSAPGGTAGRDPGGREATGTAGDAPARPLRVHAVVREPLTGRARRWLGSGSGEAEGEGEDGRTDDRVGDGTAAPAAPDGTRRVAREGLAAVVSPDPGPGGPPAGVDGELARHARIVEALAASGAVVPAPAGLVAPDEAAIRAFLDRARLALEEALDFFEGAAEMRLHVRRHPVRRDTDPPEAAAPTDAEAASAAGGLYHRLRRHARAARRLEPAAGDLLTAAFLVPRAGWSEGTEMVTRWGESQPGLLARLTGPWAPYDFVRMFPEGAAGASREGGSPARPPEEAGDPARPPEEGGGE